MPTPDEAAAVDHDKPTSIKELTDRHVDGVIRVFYNGEPILGYLKALSRNPFTGLTKLDIQEEGRPLPTAIVLPGASLCDVLEPAPSADPVIAPVDMELLRELASVSDQLDLAEGSVKDLKKRKKELSELLVEQFAANGVKNINVDGRTSYMHTSTGASFKERPPEEGGGNYTLEDLVPVLRKLGKGAYVKPETTNWQTISAVLREYHKSKEPVPDELAKMVSLKASPEIRVRAPQKG